MATFPTIGVLGGGQLGRMLQQAALPLGLELHFLDPAADCPVAGISPHLHQGDFRNPEDVLAFGQDKDIITVEIEDVAADALEQLAQQGKQVHPSPAILRTVQDKGLQKQFYAEHGLPTAPFELIDSAAELQGKPFPYVLKLRRGGYDGRGVQLVRNAEDLVQAFDAPCVVEELAPIAKELAVVVSRNAGGQVIAFPPVEMVFDAQANLLDYLLAPAQVTTEVTRNALRLAHKLAEAFGLVGVLAVEFFMLADGTLWINEVAPRPHNSGHVTIDANHTSQYEQHLRAIMGWPLGSPKQHTPAAMLNLLGAPGHEGPPKLVGLTDVMAHPGVHLHWYGKSATRPMRKMGHITLTDNDLQQLMARTRMVRYSLRVEAHA